MSGPSNAVATSAIVRVSASPEYEIGEDFTMKNGCGEICLSLKDCDKLKRMNLDLELCLRDMELIELLTGSTLYTFDPDGGANPLAPDVYGYSRRGVGASCPDPVSVEIWTKAIDNTGACPTTTDPEPTWWRTIWPRATFTLGDVTFANEIATIQLSGYVEPNPSFGDGCFNDVVDGDGVPIPLDPESPEHYLLEFNGPPALQCGYIAVP